MAFIPYSWIVWPLSLGAEEGQQNKDQPGDTAKVAARNVSPPFSFFMHWPIFSTVLAKKCSDDALRAILAWSQTQLVRIAADGKSRGFTDRLDAFKDFASLL